MTVLTFKVLPDLYEFDTSLDLNGFIAVLGMLAFILLLHKLTRKELGKLPTIEDDDLKNYSLNYSKNSSVNYEAIQGKKIGIVAKVLVWILAIILCIVPISEFIMAWKS